MKSLENDRNRKEK